MQFVEERCAITLPSDQIYDLHMADNKTGNKKPKPYLGPDYHHKHLFYAGAKWTYREKQISPNVSKVCEGP